MNRLRYVKGYFKKFISESEFRNTINRMSLSFSEDEILEGYEYIISLK